MLDEDGVVPFALFTCNAEKTWAVLRDEILARWLEERPGCRPWAWWEFDNRKGERLKVGGSGEHSAVYHGFGVFGALDCDPKDPPRIESEAAFLKRTGQLTAAEKRKLKPAAFRAVRLEVDEAGDAAPPQGA